MAKSEKRFHCNRLLVPKIHEVNAFLIYYNDEILIIIGFLLVSIRQSINTILK